MSEERAYTMLGAWSVETGESVINRLGHDTVPGWDLRCYKCLRLRSLEELHWARDAQESAVKMRDKQTKHIAEEHPVP